MSASRTQRQQVLELLRCAGRRGATQLDADALHPPVRRLASRVHDLRAAGYAVETRGRRQRLAVYRLAATAPAPPAVAHAPATLPAELFERRVGAAPPRSAIDPTFEDERRRR